MSSRWHLLGGIGIVARVRYGTERGRETCGGTRVDVVSPFHLSWLGFDFLVACSRTRYEAGSVDGKWTARACDVVMEVRYCSRNSGVAIVYTWYGVKMKIFFCLFLTAVSVFVPKGRACCGVDDRG